ncbi:hypothetical protein FZEAL_1986 [Fusarium zealandicum]|uniref:Chromo domain-containing protein n=1 Tax=Fusarium zealandicum TaxID=1053134 RepID=A0A8H4XN79_9HYPO|nr:hypothetical protein FZEAL_1986 [Fusarium zealandicum]
MASIQQPEPANPRKRKRSNNGGTRIEVQLRSRPTYVPGNGPPLERISLLPPRDTTAYILDRIYLPSPGQAADGMPLPRRMTYMVGWRDLPAAIMLIPAMRVLDYVSPQELEEWEFDMEEELDRQKEELAREETEMVPKPKKQGRPPKHSKIETSVVAVAESKTAALPKPGVMSLTTPTKNRLADFEGLSDEEGSPLRRLQPETSADSTDLDGYQGFDDIGRASLQRDMDMRLGSQLSLSHKAGSSSGTHRPSNIAGKQAMDSFPSTGASTRRSTPKPAVVNPSVEAKKKATAASSLMAQMPSLGAAGRDDGQGAYSSTDCSWTPVEGSLNYPDSDFETPQPESDTATARLMAEAARVQKKISTKPPSRPSPKSARTTPKPARATSKPARATPKPSRATSKSANPSPKSARPSPKPTRPPPKPDQQPPVEENEDPGEPVWEVKRLEDMELFEVEGMGLVRYYKVRWEGDWPPDQNPSWEPEDNLPAKLVRNYRKQGKRKRVSAPAPAPLKPKPAQKKKQKTQTTLSWGLPAGRYKSVSEAFEGAEEDEGGMGVEVEDDVLGDEEDQGHELFVVEEPPTKKSRAWNGNGTAVGMMSIYR